MRFFRPNSFWLSKRFFGDSKMGFYTYATDFNVAYLIFEDGRIQPADKVNTKEFVEYCVSNQLWFELK